MAYQVLARKYRPQGFEQIVGQEHVAQTLSNAISSNRLSSAYLFAGPRGVGKTTTARILAKSLNCLHDNKPTPNPCQECVNCQEITKGNCVDVIEIDAASNRGIDDIRSLRENIKFAPASCRYKVYIIDEAHQITPEGFNAFLKTMEEPPSHVVFVLATTEQHKIPETILSRCQRFVFRPISNKKIIDQLKHIIETEKKSVKKIEIEESLFPLIARYSQGSLRDAESLLDQLISYSSGSVKVADLVFMLGLIPQEILDEFTNLILQKNTISAFEKIVQVSEAGYNLFQFAKDLRDFFHEIMVNRFSGRETDIIAQEYLQQFRQYSDDQIWRCSRLITQAVEEMKWADQPRFVLETYIPLLTKPVVEISDLISQLEKLEQSTGQDTNSCFTEKEKKYSATPSKIPVEPVEQTPEFVPASTISPNDINPEISEPVTKNLNLSWQKILTKIRKEKLVLASYMEQSIPTLETDTLVLTFSQEFQFGMRGIENDKLLVECVLRDFFGRDIKLQCVLQTNPTIQPVKQEPELAEEPAEVVVEPPSIEPEITDTDNKNVVVDLFTSDQHLKKILKHFPQAKLIEEPIKPVTKNI